MFTRKSMIASVFSVTLIATLNVELRTTKAEEDGARRTFKVQVQYQNVECGPCFFWSTVMETSNRSQAEAYYVFLLFAEANDLLELVVPFEFGRYFPVDVRLRVDNSLQRVDFERDRLLSSRF